MTETVPYLADVMSPDRTLGQYLSEVHPKTPLVTKQRLAHVFNVLLDNPQLKQALGYPSRFSVQAQDIPDLISSVDHMGILSFPPFIDSNVLYAAWLKTAEPSVRFQWVLTCTGVPLNNASFPRGFYLAGAKIPLFRRKSERWCAWHVPGGHMDFKPHPILEQKRNIAQALFSWVQHVNQFQLRHAHEEMWVLNNYVWKTFAPHLKLEFMSVSGEDVFTQWLALGYGTWFSEFLFDIDPVLRKKINQVLDGCPGAWCSQSGRGTHLFWDVAQPGSERAPMVLDDTGRTLVGPRLSLPLERKTVRNALQDKRILPSLFTFFGLLSFDGGIVMAGGFNQLEYLYDMNRRLETLFAQGLIPDFVRMSRPKALCGFKVSPAQGIEFLFENQLTDSNFKDILNTRIHSLSRAEF